jgi:hypothetical protein
MTKKGDDPQDMEPDRVDTVPPPDGEDDAYSAPTRMHSTPPEDLLEAMKEAARKGVPLKPQTLPSRSTAPSGPDLGPKSGTQPRGDGSPPSVGSRRPPSTPEPAAKVEGTEEEWIGSEALNPEKVEPVEAPLAAGGSSRRIALPLSAVIGIAATFLVLVVVVAFLALR